MRQKESQQHTPQEVTRQESTTPMRLRAYRLIRKILLGFILVSFANVLFSFFFLTPKMYSIHRENRDMVIKYRILQDRIRTAQQQVEEIRHRDRNVYRSLFSSDTLTLQGIYQEYPSEKYASMRGDEYEQLMIPTWKQLDQLARSLYATSLSLDELQQLSTDKEQMTTAIPAIWPMDRSALKSHIGAFNPRRYHPILHRIQPHNGVDLPCARGTLIYATGDAVVDKAYPQGYNGGFGRQVILDHGFGYKTRYAHLDKVLVERGDTIRRGQVIGHAGNTGRSTSTHLHYEVLYKGRPVNPINYFNKDLTEAEYTKLMENMRETNYEKLE
ncbi:MAG: M23 family metallopeptidase [Alistipes sp.]|nr:M23 family metallopeptidase [Alistipes sp.]MBR3773983.1 M23 family metallopeptidase [Alistipes sp.]MBR4051873.1 M23 family metallopeptidase [Alistipes sp.]